MKNKKIMKSISIFSLILAMICSSVLLSPVKASTQNENNMVEFDLSNMDVGDVYIDYQDVDNNEYVKIELIEYTPLEGPQSRAIEGETEWSGTIPDGTYTLRPSKSYGVYEYSFKMTIIIANNTATINRVFSPVTDCYLVENNSRDLRIVTPKSTPTIDALAKMTWLQTNSVGGTSVGTFSAYLGCYVSHAPNSYKVYWRI